MTAPGSGLLERLRLHTTWRDSHGELNDAPNEAANTIEALVEALEECRLIVANLPHGEDLLLRKINTALAKVKSNV